MNKFKDPFETKEVEVTVTPEEVVIEAPIKEVEEEKKEVHKTKFFNPYLKPPETKPRTRSEEWAAYYAKQRKKS